MSNFCTTIKAGRYILLKDNSGVQRILRAVAGDTITHNKSRISVDQIIGKTFGSFFQIVDAKTGDLREITDS
jgi:hypothetical protein